MSSLPRIERVRPSFTPGVSAASPALSPEAQAWVELARSRGLNSVRTLLPRPVVAGPDPRQREIYALREQLHAKGNECQHAIAKATLPMAEQITALQVEKEILNGALTDTMLAAATLAERHQRRVSDLESALSAEEAAHAATRRERDDHHDRLNDAQAIILRQRVDAGESRQDAAADLRAGLDEVRAALDRHYPNRQPLSLTQKIDGLAKERDMWRKQAERAEASHRALTRQAAYDAQRKQE